MLLTRFRIDILFATILLALASVIFASAYSTIVRNEGSGRTLIRTIPIEETHYALVMAGRCIGTVQSEVQFLGDVYSLRTESTVATQLGDQQIPWNLTQRAEFSAIGMHQGTTTTIKGKDIFVRVTTLELDPMRVTMRGAFEKEKFQFQVVVPGPLMLKRNSGNSFRLEYLHLGKVLESYNSFANNDLFHNPALKTLSLIPTTQDKPCGAIQEGALDMSPLLSLLSSGTFAELLRLGSRISTAP